MAEALREISNRYRTLATLGEGGMGVVYLVEDTTTQRQVALKVLSSQLARDERVLQGFKQEFRMMSKLKHPNNCEAYDYGAMPDGTPYFTMEVVPGQGLDEALPLGTEVMNSVLSQVCLTLAFIHQQGFVHCDLKPENIRIKPDGTVKLMDFGLMEVSGQSGGAIKGTLAYLAPEVAKRDRIDQRSDIYSLGAVAYQLLTGQTPFRGSTPVEVLRAHLNETPRPLRQIDKAIPVAMEQVVLKMLAKEPIARYQSCYDVLSSLGIEVDDRGAAMLLAPAFVGRHPEMARLGSALERLKDPSSSDSRGGALWIAGPGGVGKTRLLGEFRFAAQLAEVPFYLGTCSAQRAPYEPFVEVLRQLLPVMRERCQTLLTEHAGLLGKLLPELGDGSLAPLLEPDQEKVLLQSLVTNLVIRATEATGAVLVLEAWDLADSLSQEMLTYLMRNAESAPLLLVVSSRDASLAKAPVVLTLSALDQAETSAVVASMLGLERIDDALAQQVFELSAGNGQLIGDLLDHLLRVGAFERAQGRWTLPRVIDAAHIPKDLKATWVERLSTLPERAQRVAEFAAVFGEPFGLGLAAAVLSLGDDALFDALEALMRANVLDGSDGLYAFANQDLGATLYETLEEVLKRSLHDAVTDYLAGLTPDDERTVTEWTRLARQALRGSDADRAIRLALKAGELNRSFVATAAAQMLLNEGYALLMAKQRAGVDMRPWLQTWCEYTNHLAGVAIYTHNLDECAEYLEKGLALAGELGDKNLEAQLLATKARLRDSSFTSEGMEEAALISQRVIELATETGNIRLQTRTLVNLARQMFFRGLNTQAQDLFQQAVDIAKAHDVTFYYARALCFLGFLKFSAGGATRDEGYRDLFQAIDLQLRIGDKYGEGYSYMLLNNVQQQTGRFTEAVESTNRYYEIVTELGVNDDRAVALLNRLFAYFEMGQFERVIELAQGCHDFGVEVSHGQVVPVSLTVWACAAYYTGQSTLGDTLLARGEELARQSSSYTLSYVVPYLIEARLHAGRLQEALIAAQEARDLVASQGNTEIESKLWVYLGEIHTRQGEYPAARSYFQRSREHALRADEPHHEARASKGLGVIDLLDGQFDSAEAHLNRALSLSKRLSMACLTADVLYQLGRLSLARQDKPQARGYFDEALDQAVELRVPALEAVVLHGLSQAVSKKEEQKRFAESARARLNALLTDMTEELKTAFLSFTERAQIMREDVVEVATFGTTLTAVVPEQPSLSEDASVDERVAWLRQEMALTAQVAAQAAARAAAVTREYEALTERVAIDHPRVRELELANRRMEQLIKFSTALSKIQDLGRILEDAVDMIVELTGAERGFLLFLENGQIRSQVSRVNVDRHSPMDWQFSKSIADQVLSTGEVVCVFDALADHQFNQAQSVVDLNLRTVICVPMKVNGRLVGAIYVDRQSVTDSFTPNDLEMVLSLAAQAAGAIENARLHQEWVDKSKRLEMLNNLSKTISGSLEMEEVLDLIVKMTLEVSRAERGFLFLLGDDQSGLICRAARDTSGSLPLDADHEIAQSICTKVLTTGEPENVADALNDEEFQFQQSIMALNLRMVMCVPITNKGTVIGLLYVDSQAVVNAFGDKDLELLLSIAGHAAVAIDNAKLHAKTARLADDLQKMFYSFVQALGTSIDAKHPLTSGHSWRVTEYSVRLARRIGLPPSEVENIRIAGLLHDVGKIGTPDHILMKPGSFTNEEYETMKRHVVHTKEILDTIYFPESQRHIPAVAGAHHEKWDGKGYPNRQAGEEIPLGGRILALGDVFDAITSKRDYREAMPLSQALNIIRQGIGTHFDPALGPVFIEMIEEEGIVYHENDLETGAPKPQSSDAIA